MTIFVLCGENAVDSKVVSDERKCEYFTDKIPI